MSGRVFFGVTLAVLVGGAAVCGQAGTLRWENPLVEKRADPHVFLHTDGYYYLTATVPEYDAIEVRRARSIDGLSRAPAKTIWRKHDKGEMGAHIWAPEIHFIDGAWYVYFTSAPAEHIWEIRPYVLKCGSKDPLGGKWEEMGQITPNRHAFSLDATTFAHKGKRYYVWTERGDKPNDGTNIYIAEMDSPTSFIGEPVMLSCPEYAWETQRYRVNEAPAVLIWKDKVYMTYSASATDHNYCLGLLTADADANLLDAKSWTKSKDPVFKSNEATSQYGPGHNSFTTTPDGSKVIMVYHSRNYFFRDGVDGNALYNHDRATYAKELKWNEDGTPDFGVPEADGKYSMQY